VSCRRRRTKTMCSHLTGSQVILPALDSKLDDDDFESITCFRLSSSYLRHGVVYENRKQRMRAWRSIAVLVKLCFRRELQEWSSTVRRRLQHQQNASAYSVTRQDTTIPSGLRAYMPAQKPHDVKESASTQKSSRATNKENLG
jgi:hypothetical protein